VARALDVVGERWTPLIVRELLLGPKRYTDLIDSLPGVGTNILAARLADLQEAGVVVKRTLPPPTPVVVYELTEAGEALAPVIRELRSWGRRFAPAPKSGDAARPGWVIQSAVARGHSLPEGRACELRVGQDVFELGAAAGQTAARARAAADPDTIITIEPRVFFRLAHGGLSGAAAAERITVDGDRGLADQVLAMLEGAAA
jgi:DNA-binding HxlR family transcriptional regulator